MAIALLFARLVLATVFIVSGIAKFMDRPGSRKALLDFGVPVVLVTPLVLLLPLSEIAIAVALIPLVSAWWGAVGALVLLLLFIVAIAINLAQGRKPDCHCFGQLDSAPIGWKTLARNGALALLAGFVVFAGNENPGPSVLGWLTGLTIIEFVAGVFALIVLGVLFGEAWFMLHLLRQHGRMLIRLDTLERQLSNSDTAIVPTRTNHTAGLPVGSPAPTFALTNLDGKPLTLDLLRATKKPVMLIFLDPSCGTCTSLLPEIARWQRDYATRMNITIISRGSVEANRANRIAHGLTDVLVQQDYEVSNAYDVGGTPSALVIRPDGTIGSSIAAGADEIRAMIASNLGLPPSAVHRRNGNANGSGTPIPHPVGVQIGESAPALRLADLAGKVIDLKDFRGAPTLVLFWNPDCGYCKAMLKELQAWEMNLPSGAPRLLLVSSGSVEANQALRLHAPVVLDQSFSVGHTFGARGTPSGVLISAEGLVASSLAVGASAILELARVEKAQATSLP